MLHKFKHIAILGQIGDPLEQLVYYSTVIGPILADISFQKGYGYHIFNIYDVMEQNCYQYTVLLSFQEM